ncbi:MAG: hypothetical protein WCG87_09945 [Bacteroidota bacterium]
MANSSSISNWLNKPFSYNESDRKNIAALILKYPYFVPTRYMEAAQLHEQEFYAPAMLDKMQLYKGNWLLFNEFLQVENETTIAPSGRLNQKKIEIDTEEEIDIDAQLKQIEEELKASADVEINTHEVLSLKEDNTETQAEVVPTFDEMRAEVDFISEEPEISSKTPDFIEVASNINHVSAISEQSIWEEDPEDEIEEDAVVISTAQMINPLEETTPIEESINSKVAEAANSEKENLIQPYYTEDYFLHVGIPVSNDIPEEVDQLSVQNTPVEDPKSLMVVMSFTEWLTHFKTKGEKAKEEQQDQKNLKTMWQKEKLAAAMEEENEEIPENVFAMAVNSITKEDDLASESLAEILIKQGKHDKAIDMFRKLSLRNPQKSTYFARRIEGLIKEKES